MEVKTGYKQTEAGVLPVDWDVQSLGALEKLGVVKLFRGKVISRKDISQSPGDFPIYSSSVHNDGLFGRYGLFMFDEELITWSIDGGGHFFHRSRHKFAVTNVCGYMRVDSARVDCQYLASQLQHLHSRKLFDYQLKAHPSVIRGAYSVPIPTLPEQRSITTVLSDVDALLGGLDRLIAKKRDLKQAVMQQLLTGQTRLPGFHGEWEAVEFGDIAFIRNTKVIPWSMPAGTRCVELEAIDHGSGRLLMSVEATGLSSKYRFKRGDVLFGRLRAYLRKYWLATFDGVCSTEIWPLVARDERVSGGFLHLLVQTNEFVNAAGVSYGTHMPRSDWSVLKKLPVRLPPFPEQVAIAAVLSDMEAELAALKAKRAKTRDLKQAMMQELLTGKTRLVHRETANV
jgi:restriction endonuclease S subunit